MKLKRNCFETVLFQFHLVVRTVFVACSYVISYYTKKMPFDTVRGVLDISSYKCGTDRLPFHNNRLETDDPCSPVSLYPFLLLFIRSQLFLSVESGLALPVC